MATSAVDAIAPAFAHTKQQLLEPFQLSQWAKLALVGMLAGELTSGGCNVRSFTLPARTPQGSDHLLDLPALPHVDPAVYAGLIAFLVIFGFVFFVLILYVSSVMRFVLLDAVIARRCEVARSWNRRHGAGLGYFVWKILLFLVAMVGTVIFVGVPLAFALAAGWLKAPKEHMAPLILGGIAMLFLALAFAAAIAVVHVMTKDFVVPQMALDDVSAIEGWQRLLPMLKAEKGSYVGYIALKVVMALATAVVVGIAATIVVLLMAIPLGGLGAVAILMGKASGLQWDLYTISLAVLVGILALGFVLYVVSLVSVPAMVFFPAYSLYFFAGRYPKLAEVMYPQTAPVPTPLAAPIPPPLPQG